MSGPPVPALPHSSFAPFLWDSEAREEPDGNDFDLKQPGIYGPRRSVDSLEKGQDGLVFLLFSNGVFIPDKSNGIVFSSDKEPSRKHKALGGLSRGRSLTAGFRGD